MTKEIVGLTAKIKDYNDAIAQFQPLLRKYAYKLHYEDAYEDLVLKLIEVMKRLDSHSMEQKGDQYFLSYILKSMVHEYIRLSKLKRYHEKTYPLSALVQEGQKYLDIDLDDQWTCQDNHLELEYRSLFSSICTPYEAKILVDIYLQHRTTSEIAQKNRVSAPAISQAKRNALRKIREYLQTDSNPILF